MAASFPNAEYQGVLKVCKTLRFTFQPLIFGFISYLKEEDGREGEMF